MPHDDDAAAGHNGRSACAANAVPTMTVREALAREPRPIEVPDGETFELSPRSRDGAAFVQQVKLQSFADLQALGLVPRRLAEDKVRQAVKADDDLAFQMSLQRQPAAAEAPCGCGGHSAPARPGAGLRGTYESIRRGLHPALAAVMSDHLGTQVAWDSPAVSIVRRWLQTAAVSKALLVALAEDITINRNATLVVDPSLRNLLARHIYIHTTGQMVYGGGYLKVFANSIQAFSFRILASDAVRAAKPIWALND